MKIKFKGIKLNIIKRLKTLKIKKDKEIKQEGIKTEEIEGLPQKVEEVELDEPEEQPVKEYRETLYSVGHVHDEKTQSPDEEKKSYAFKRREDFGTIEENIDDIGKEKKIRNSSDINKKVDWIISKKKK